MRSFSAGSIVAAMIHVGSTILPRHQSTTGDCRGGEGGSGDPDGGRRAAAFPIATAPARNGEATRDFRDGRKARRDLILFTGAGEVARMAEIDPRREVEDGRCG